MLSDNVSCIRLVLPNCHVNGDENKSNPPEPQVTSKRYNSHIPGDAPEVLVRKIRRGKGKEDGEGQEVARVKANRLSCRGIREIVFRKKGQSPACA